MAAGRGDGASQSFSPGSDRDTYQRVESRSWMKTRNTQWCSLRDRMVVRGKELDLL